MQNIIDILVSRLNDHWSYTKDNDNYIFHGLNGRKVKIVKDNNLIIAKVIWPELDGYRFDPSSCDVKDYQNVSEIQNTWRCNSDPILIVSMLMSKIFSQLEAVYPAIEECFLDHQERREELSTRIDSISALLDGNVKHDGLEATLKFTSESGVSGRLTIENQISITHSIELHHISQTMVDQIIEIISSSSKLEIS